ncbi:nas-28, partial [Symbiodinium sp. CCMP2456]
MLHDKQLSAHAAGCLKLALELLEKVNQHVLEDGDLDPNAPAEVMEWYRHSKPE